MLKVKPAWWSPQTTLYLEVDHAVVNVTEVKKKASTNYETAINNQQIIQSIYFKSQIENQGYVNSAVFKCDINVFNKF